MNKICEMRSETKSKPLQAQPKRKTNIQKRDDDIFLDYSGVSRDARVLKNFIPQKRLLLLVCDNIRLPRG